MIWFVLHILVRLVRWLNLNIRIRIVQANRIMMSQNQNLRGAISSQNQKRFGAIKMNDSQHGHMQMHLGAQACIRLTEW